MNVFLFALNFARNSCDDCLMGNEYDVGALGNLNVELYFEGMLYVVL